MRFAHLFRASAAKRRIIRALEFHVSPPVIFLIVLLPAGARGQTAPSNSPDHEVDDAVRRVQQNDLGTGPVDALFYVTLIADARATQALPVLEQYYPRTSDPEIRAGVASALVRMGDKNGDYWSYLVQLATPAAESDAPLPLKVEQASKGDKDFYSPEFKAWAIAHNLSVEAAFKAVTMLPVGLAPLAQTGDPRGIPLLRKVLMSPNILIASVAAAGLAQAQDKASIPMIIDACKRAPPSLANFLADSLLFFDDPDAIPPTSPT